ncbi:MAG: hypothetical protein JKX94_00790 [Sneathiella sp.]|nr:hypothetical protein [Sneathiella sp.]
MFKKLLVTVAATVLAFSAVPSSGQAATLTALSDNFNTETLSLNYNSFANWNVSNGTVDLIGPGFFALCGGTRCVDMDGSTANAGDLTTKDNFAIGSYALSFRIAGNQRGGAADGMVVTFGDLNELFVRNPFDPFGLVQRTVNLAALDFLTFSHNGGDNIGILLDDVTIRQLSVIPLPAALPLYGAGLAVMGFIGWRRKMKNKN